MQPDWSVILGVLGSLILLAVLAGALLGIRALMRSSDEDEAKRRARQIEDDARVEEARRRRWEELCGRFGPQAAEAILRGVIWQGETEEELVASLGPPADVDREVLKTKTKMVFKYRPIAAGRYGLRVRIENGIVVGWDEK